MNEEIMSIKYQACNIDSALLRNINDNFKSVSFDIIKSGGDIVVKIILDKRTKIEDDYIEEIITEFSALQITNCVTTPQIEIGDYHLPLKNLVYQKIV